MADLVYSVMEQCPAVTGHQLPPLYRVDLNNTTILALLRRPFGNLHLRRDGNSRYFKEITENIRPCTWST